MQTKRNAAVFFPTTKTHHQLRYVQDLNIRQHEDFKMKPDVSTRSDLAATQQHHMYGKYQKRGGGDEHSHTLKQVML